MDCLPCAVHRCDYDWDRLDFLCKKMDQVRAPVRAEIEEFLTLLAAL